jgi:hypothetical protein
MSNQNRINLMADLGVTSRDSEICDAMLEFSLHEWNYVASKLLTAEIVPNQPLILHIDLSAMHQQQLQQESVNWCTKRSGAAQISNLELRFNRILAVPENRLERFVPDMLVRDLSMMPSENGNHSSVCAAMYVQDHERVPVVLKIRKLTNKDSDLATKHEQSALKVLR